MGILIIAEAGVNHNGSLELAKKMALEAKNAGADIVKYQTCMPEMVVSRFAEKAEYQKQITGDGESQLAMIKKIHFGFDGHKELKEYCDSIGIQYLSAAFDLPSVDFLESLDLPYHKIPSGEITNLPYLERIGKTHRKVLLSTGMSSMKEIGEAVEVLKQNGSGDIILLHCNTEYPTPYADANLRAMTQLKKFTPYVGYSDHTAGFTADIAAAAMGACVIEKHFTLDKNMPGPDHKASLDTEELRLMCKAIRDTEILLGNGEKKVTESERKNISVARKSIVAAENIKAGEVFTAKNLLVKRPGTGISPMRWYEVLGKTAKRDFSPDECIEL